MERPSKIFNMPWGSNVNIVLATFGLNEGDWKRWDGDHSYMTLSMQSDTKFVMIPVTSLRLFAANGLLEGVQFVFCDCANRWSGIHTAVIVEYKLENVLSDDIYVSWSTGEVVRLVHDQRDDTCELTVAGPKFGPVFARYLLHKGLKNLARSFIP